MAKMDFDKFNVGIVKAAQSAAEFIKDVKSGVLRQRMFKELSESIRSDYKAIFNMSIQQYYDNYEPDYYNRQYSLFDMFDIVIKPGDDVYWEMGPEFAESYYNVSNDDAHRVDIDYVYEKMFEQGWHGGATYSDKLDANRKPYPPGFEMAFRKPVEDYISGGRLIGRYSLWSHRKPEKDDLSPKANILKNLDAYSSGGSNYSGSTMDERTETMVQHQVIDKYSGFFKNDLFSFD